MLTYSLTEKFPGYLKMPSPWLPFQTAHAKYLQFSINSCSYLQIYFRFWCSCTAS